MGLEALARRFEFGRSGTHHEFVSGVHYVMMETGATKHEVSPLADDVVLLYCILMR